MWTRIQSMLRVVMQYAVYWFYRWLTGWADIVDGVCWVVTLGLWRPEASLRAEKLFLDWIEVACPDMGTRGSYNKDRNEH